MVSAQIIILQYVCPSFGMIAANVMFAGETCVILFFMTNRAHKCPCCVDLTDFYCVVQRRLRMCAEP